MKTILGIDIGTSGTKTILVDDQGRVIAAKTIEYPMETPKPGWTQQNPQDWWAASVESIRAVLAKADVPAQDIAAIGLSGQMHGMVALDEHDQVGRPSDWLGRPTWSCSSSATMPCIWPDNPMAAMSCAGTSAFASTARMDSAEAAHQSCGFCCVQPGLGVSIGYSMVLQRRR